MARRLVATVVVGSVIEQRRYRLGSGAATLSDALLSAGWSDVTVLDVSTQALGIGADRFGDCRTDVSSVTADVPSFRAHRRYDAPPRPTPVQACPDRFDVSGRAESRRPSSGDGLDLCPEATQV
jgi:predicted RNA methylase